MSSILLVVVVAIVGSVEALEGWGRSVGMHRVMFGIELSVTVLVVFAEKKNKKRFIIIVLYVYYSYTIA